MKAFCEGIDLSDAVLKVVKACATKTVTPVLEMYQDFRKER